MIIPFRSPPGEADSGHLDLRPDDRLLKELHLQFLDRIASLNNVSMEAARESNPIATALGALFKAYCHALEADHESTALNVTKINKRQAP